MQWGGGLFLSSVKAQTYVRRNVECWTLDAKPVFEVGSCGNPCVGSNTMHRTGSCSNVTLFGYSPALL